MRGAIVAVSSGGTQKQLTRATAGETGEFEIENLAAGAYTVTASHAEYDKAVLANVELTAEETKSLRSP